jgi:isopentenyl diphosphate isomerase/L-lactate dehydrogenase-like FMN-dependent dehydrogenase
MIGRPYLFGLGVSGETGVAKALTILRTEVERCMSLLGCRSVKEISKEFLNEHR